MEVPLDYTEIRIDPRHVDPAEASSFIRSIGGFFANVCSRHDEWINDADNVVAILQRARFLTHLEDFHWWADRHKASLVYDLIETKTQVVVKFSWSSDE